MQLAALADYSVELVNEAGTDYPPGDFKLMLGSATAATTSLGYAENYAWQIDSTDETTAYFMQGSEKGWTVVTEDEDGDPVQQIRFDDRLDPTDTSKDGLKTILTVTGLNNPLKVNYDSNTATDKFKDIDFTAIGTTVTAGESTNDPDPDPETSTETDNFIPGLQIITAYRAAAAKDDPATTEVDESKAANGTITIKRNVLDKGTLTFSGDASDKYDLKLFDNAKETGASEETFVPTSNGAKIQYWLLNDGAAVYREGTAEYWTVSGNKVTYTNKTAGSILAKITGIDTESNSVMDGSAYEAAQKYTGTDGKYTITGSYVFKGSADASPAEAEAAKC